MAQRYFNDDLMTALDTLLPSATGDLSASQVRDVLRSVIMTLRDTGSQLLQTTANVTLAATTTPQKMPNLFQVASNGDLTELSASSATQNITVLNDKGYLRMDGTFAIEGPNNTEVSLHLFKDGVQAPNQILTANLEGAGNPIAISTFNREIPIALNEVFDVRVSASGSATLTFNQCSWVTFLTSSRNTGP